MVAIDAFTAEQRRIVRAPRGQSIKVRIRAKTNFVQKYVKTLEC